MILADYERENAPRGSHGVLVSEATDPKNNPLSPEATGRFVAAPRADYAQSALDKAVKARRDEVGDVDWPLMWVVRHEAFGEHEN